MSNSDFKVGFWGCRGSMAVGGADLVKYGTNSCCVSVECGGMLLLFDVGTGFVCFEEYYRQLPEQKEINVFISHYHLDHIVGLPFAGLLFDPSVQMNFHGRSVDGVSPRDIIGELYRPPYFPTDLMNILVSERLKFREIGDVDTIELAGGRIVVDTLLVNHPGGSSCFRVSYNGKSLVYLSDYDYNDNLDPRLAELLVGTDMVIFDAFFSDNNYREGWGHSTWQEGVYLSELLNIRSFYMFHHNIKRTDDELDELQTLISRRSNRCFIAKEGSFVYI